MSNMNDPEQWQSGETQLNNRGGILKSSSALRSHAERDHFDIKQPHTASNQSFQGRQRRKPGLPSI